MDQRQRMIGLLLMILATVAGSDAGHSSAAIRQNNNYRLVITVTSADRNEPVEGASVTVKYMFDPAFAPIRLETQTTDAAGKVWVIPAAFGGFSRVQPKPGARFDIAITHPDYYDAYRPVPVRKDTQSGDVPVGVSLRRKAGTKVVAVQVFEKGDRAPIYDATVKLRGTMSSTLFSGTTNSGGQALISITEADNYQVSVTHTGFESVNATLPIKMYDGQREYNLSFEMKRTTEEARLLRVSVKGKDKQGRIVPVRYAQVTLPDGQTKTTDYEGIVSFRHKLPPGEEVKVEAEATYYKPGSSSFTVGVRKLTSDTVSISLERKDADDDDSAEERLLKVSVKGKDKQGKIVPVRYAQITLADGQTKTTDYEGAVTFKHKLPPGSVVKVEAEATYYKPAASTFTVGGPNLSTDTVSISLEREDADDDCSGFAGHWATNGGALTIRLTGNSAAGNYEYRGPSTLAGTVSGNVLDGNWSQPTFPDPNTRSGRMQFTLAPDGKSFSGKWWDSTGAYRGAWNGTRSGCP